jgi:hypothetical protein
VKAPTSLLRLSLQQLSESPYIDLSVALRIELNRPPGDQEKWRYSITVTDRVTQLSQAVAQVAASGLIRPSGPEQPDQYVASVRSIRFRGQIG